MESSMGVCVGAECTNWNSRCSATPPTPFQDFHEYHSFWIGNGNHKKTLIQYLFVTHPVQFQDFHKNPYLLIRECRMLLRRRLHSLNEPQGRSQRHCEGHSMKTSKKNKEIQHLLLPTPPSHPPAFDSRICTKIQILCWGEAECCCEGSTHLMSPRGDRGNIAMAILWKPQKHNQIQHLFVTPSYEFQDFHVNPNLLIGETECCCEGVCIHFMQHCEGHTLKTTKKHLNWTFLCCTPVQLQDSRGNPYFLMGGGCCREGVCNHVMSPRDGRDSIARAIIWKPLKNWNSTLFCYTSHSIP